MATDASRSETTREHRRERYERLLGIVDHNTSGPDGPQRAAMSQPVLTATMCRAGYEPGETRSALQAAREQGDVFTFRDRNGLTRIARSDPESISAIVAEENQHRSPDVDLLRRCKRAIRGDSDG